MDVDKFWRRLEIKFLIVSVFIVFSLEETPVGVEPTSTGLQPVAWPSGSSVFIK